MTNLQKKDIVSAIETEILALGSANKVAIKCKVSSGTISQMRKENWDLISKELWLQVASELNYKFDDWIIVPTTNYRMMKHAITEAKEECYFLPISDKAGSGKTTGIQGFIKENNHGYNYFLKCRQWAAREFLEYLLGSLGLEIPRGYPSLDKLGQRVINFFIERKNERPSLCIDQANSLKPSALKFIIHLYNEMEDNMSLIVVGTEALEKEIKRGVRYQKDGYDEIDSRLGRNYLKLFGNTLSDIKSICSANGITDNNQQKLFFEECRPVPKTIQQNNATVVIKVVEDTRRIKRIIKRERKKILLATEFLGKEVMHA